MKQDFSERISFIEDDISGLKTELDAVRAGLVNQTGWLAQFRQYRNLAKLTRTVVVNLIDKILSSYSHFTKLEKKWLILCSKTPRRFWI